MTASPEPWSIGPGGQILDANGKTIGIFSDYRDTEKVIELTQFVATLETEIENLECRFSVK